MAELQTIRKTAIDALREFIRLSGTPPTTWENGRASPTLVLDLLNYIEDLEERTGEKDEIDG